MMVVIALIGIFFRYVLANALSWTEELTRYMMILVGMFGTALALWKDEHVGFDDIHFSAHANPPLTTVSVPIHRLGYEAAILLIDATEAEGTPIKSRSTVQCHLVTRGSTGPVS